MRILITGAYGFVGTNLCRYLVERGHACEALDLPSARRADVPYSAVHTWDELDQTSSLILHAFDAVVHLAGKAHDLKKVASEQSYFDINVGLTQKLISSIKFQASGAGLKSGLKFIYFSSSKASATGNAYGRSKLAAEEYLQSECSNDPQIRTVVLRPAMIHGPGNKGNLNLLWGIARRGFPWPLAAFENRRSFTSIGNICAAVEALAAKSLESSDVQHSSSMLHVFPIADDEMLSTNRLIELMAEACGRKPRLWKLPKGLMRLVARIGDVLHLPITSERLGKLTEDSFVDNGALKKALGWEKMPVGAEEGMRQTLASFAKQSRS